MNTAGLNSVIHPPNRLQICALLSPLERAEFRVLRDELDVSDSVLSKHLTDLESAGYVRRQKDVAEGRRRTWIALTASGRRAFADHVETLQQLANSSLGPRVDDEAALARSDGA